jgi:hypothetical protein
MKPILPHDPLDDLMAAALHGELSPAERTAFETRLQNDPAARAAYQETRLMHDLLEKTHREAQPDPAFEERMISGVRRKLQQETAPRETAWQSLLALWAMIRGGSGTRRYMNYALAGVTLLLLAVCIMGLPPAVTGALKKAPRPPTEDYTKMASADAPEPNSPAAPTGSASDAIDEVTKAKNPTAMPSPPHTSASPPVVTQLPSIAESEDHWARARSIDGSSGDSDSTVKPPQGVAADGLFASRMASSSHVVSALPENAPQATDSLSVPASSRMQDQSLASATSSTTPVPPLPGSANAPTVDSAPVAAAPSAPQDTRKLIRNAQLDLEVKSFQSAADQIAALTKAAGGYVDTSNSQRGGNGKLQGTIVVKVLPQNLDGFLLKLRDLGDVRNQSVSTDDVTKAYVDLQARLDNSRRMETQLQELLKHDNGRVSDLLQVERELGRVRGDIEQAQGELKLYDFQVEYATATLTVEEKDLDQAAAYLLKERDQFSLFSTDVEATFKQARQAADTFQGHILEASLNHNSGGDVSALLIVSVPPEQIEAFLAQVKTLGRVDNFIRRTERVARDGGDTDQPADQTLTQKDKVLVHLSIRSDDEARKQVSLTVVTPAVEDALEKAKAAALAQPGANILSSSFNKTTEGASAAAVSVRVPGKNYPALLAALRALGRASSFSVERDDNADENAPVVLSLTLTDDETPVQQTELSILSTDIDARAQELKKEAAAEGAEIKSSSFERQPDGQEIAQMTLRLPMAKYPGFIESLKKLGRMESLTVHRVDRPDQARTDESAPAEIDLQLHSEGEIVADDNGLWATLRRTFGEGAAALLNSVRMIGVIVAFLVPWVVTLIFAAWIGRRIYIARRK